MMASCRRTSSKGSFFVVEHIDFYRARRALPGQGEKKARLLKEFWQADNLITHYIIAGVAGDKDGPSKRGRAEAERDIIARALLLCTKESK